MSGQKTTLLFLRNQDLKQIKVETERENELMKYIPTDNITKQNELIYVGAKLVSDEIGIHWMNLIRNTKPWWKIGVERQIKKMQQQTKLLRKIKRSRNQRNENLPKRQLQINHLEEINQKILAREGRLTKASVQSIFNETGHLKITRENSTDKLLERPLEPNYNRIQKNAKEFWSKIWRRKDHKRKAEWINYHHHHLVMPSARISLTFSRHPSLSIIASGVSPGLHPVSSQSCCM